MLRNSVYSFDYQYCVNKRAATRECFLKFLQYSPADIHQANVTWHVAEPMNSLVCPQIIRRTRDKNVVGVTNWMQKTRSFWRG